MSFGGNYAVWKRLYVCLSILFLTSFAAGATTAQEINEVMYETSSPAIHKEFVEIFLSTGAINLTGFTIADASQTDTLEELRFVPASRFAVIIPKGSSLTIPANASVYEVDDGAIGNGLTHNDLLTFANVNGKILDTINLTAFSKTRTDFSLERFNFSNTSFSESLIIQGTPGKRNSLNNNPPILNPIGNLSVNENTPLTIQLNATDPDNDPLTFSIIATTLPNTFSFNTSGFFSWTPTFDDAGTYTATFSVTDGIATTQEIVQILVNNVNRPPQFTSIPLTTLVEDTTATVNLSQYASDPDGDPLTFAVVPANNITITIVQTTGIATITPDPDFFGNRTAIFVAKDPSSATASTVAKIEVTPVNDPPQITSQPNLSATQDIQYQYDLQVVDVENDPLTITLAQAPGGMSISSENNLTWTPNNTQVRPTPVSIKVTDSSNASVEQNFTLQVANVNDPPQINSTPVTAVTQNNSYVYQVTANDPDLALGTEVLTFSLTQAPLRMGIDPSTGAIAWVPQANQIGSHPVTVKVTDLTGATDTQPFTVTVTNLNDPPTPPQLINPINGVTIRDPTVTLNWTASTDPDGDPITYLVYIANSTNLTLLTTTPITSYNTPVQNLQTYFWQVIATDGSLNASSSVETFSTSFFNPPVITTLTPSTTTPTINENTPLNFSIQVMDPDGDPLTVEWFVDGIRNNSLFTNNLSNFTYTPSFAGAGKHNITVTATDTTGRSSFVFFDVTVNNVNRPPQMNPLTNQVTTQGTTLTFTVTATDPDLPFGEVLTYTANNPSFTLTKNNETEASVSFTPTNSQVGNNQVTFTVTDTTGASDNKTLTVNVSNLNDPPTITSQPVTTATINVPYLYIVTADDPDLQLGDILTFTLTTAPIGMSIAKINNQRAEIRWTPNASEVPGNYPVVFQVTDTAGLTANQSYSLQLGLLGSGAILVVDTFNANNPTFGDRRQEASNPLSEDNRDFDIFDPAIVTIRNGGPLTLSNFTITASPKTGFTTKDINFSVQSVPASLTPNQNGNIGLRARIPEHLDAADQEGNAVAFAVADITITAQDSLGAPLKATFEAFMQRSNELTINDVDAIINGKSGKSIDDDDDVKNLKPGDGIDLDVEAENNFNDEMNLDIEDVDLIAECDDETDIDFEDKTEEMGDIGTEDKEIETITLDIEEDAKDEKTRCMVMILGVDENGAVHGEHLSFNLEVERKTHDLQIEDLAATPNTITCQTTSLTLRANVRNLGKSNEDDTVVEIISKGLSYQMRLSSFELDEDDTQDFQVTIPVPEKMEAGSQAIQVKTFYDRTKESNAQIIQVENQCGERTVLVTKEPQAQATGTLQVSVGQSTLEVKRGEFVSIPVRVTNPGREVAEFIMRLTNIEDFAEPAASKRIFLSPGQTDTVFLNLKVREEAPQQRQSATLIVEANGVVVASETLSLDVNGKKKDSNGALTIFLILANFFIIIILIFLIDKYLVRKY